MGFPIMNGVAKEERGRLIESAYIHIAVIIMLSVHRTLLAKVPLYVVLSLKFDVNPENATSQITASLI